MADQHIPLGEVDILPLNQPPKGFFVTQGRILGATHQVGYHGGTDEGQQVKGHRTKSVREGDTCNGFLRGLGRQTDHVDVLMLQHAAEQVDPGSAVVVAADDQNLPLGNGLMQLGQKAVEQGHGLP